MIKNIVGTPVRHEDCFGREIEVDILWEKLERGHVLLAAPRRFGKTSIMYQLRDHPRDGRKVIYLDLEHFSDPREFLIELAAVVAERSELVKLVKAVGGAFGAAWDFVKGNFGSFDVGEFKITLRDSEAFAKNWMATAETLFKALNSSDEPVIVMLDEFSIMVQHMIEQDPKEADRFMHWFRKLRIDPAARLNRVRFVVAGSINLDSTLDQLGIVATINDLERLYVGPFSQPQALEFVKQLFAGKRLHVGDDEVGRMLHLVGPPIPYFIQLVVDEVYKAHRYHSRQVSVALIDEVYRDSVLGSSCKTYFQHYYSRLRDYYGADEIAAKAMLKELARAELVSQTQLYLIYSRATGASATEDGFCRLIATLENDFYIVRICGTEDYSFICKPLKDWWRRWHGMETDTEKQA